MTPSDQPNAAPEPTGFEVKIKLGNETMQLPSEIAEALRDLASGLEDNGLGTYLYDANGNTIGEGRFTFDD